MLGVYNYTVMLTYFGMLTGFSGITYAVSGNRRSALICLMIAGLCDMFDGKIASTRKRTKQEKRFGIQIDSLSDLVCFGVLPSLIVYTAGSGIARFIPSAIYLLCTLIRLAWFNIDEEERQDLETGCRSVYYGLPVTASALILPAMMWLCGKYDWNTGYTGGLILIVMAAAFLIPFRVKKPKLADRTRLFSRICEEMEQK